MQNKALTPAICFNISGLKIDLINDISIKIITHFVGSFCIISEVKINHAITMATIKATGQVNILYRYIKFTVRCSGPPSSRHQQPPQRRGIDTKRPGDVLLSPATIMPGHKQAVWGRISMDGPHEARAVAPLPCPL
jgi:hypothetical protein